jgi:hypothetical protein
MPSTQRNQQLIPDDYRKESDTTENSSSLSSPIIVDMPSTPHTMRPMMHTLPSTVQGPPMGPPHATTPTPTNNALLLNMHQIMMQIQTDLACSNAHISELEQRNQELHDKMPAARYLCLRTSEVHKEMRQPVSPAARSSQLVLRTPEPRSPCFKSEIFPEDLPSQGHLDNMPRGYLVMYADPILTHLTPRHAMFEDSHPTPQ